MLHLIEAVSSWALELIAQLGYLGIFLVMILEIVFPPIPSEVVIPFAGHLAGQGRFAFPWVVAVGTAGSVAGATLLYFLGRLFQESSVRAFLRRFGKFLFLFEKDLDTALSWFRRYGEAVVFFGRLIPIVRSLISVPAGFSRMRFDKFLTFTAAGSALWTFLLALGGKVFGENYLGVREYVERYEKTILAFLVGAILWFLVRRISWLRRAS